MMNARKITSILAFAGATGCASGPTLEAMTAAQAGTPKPIVVQGTEFTDDSEKNTLFTAAGSVQIYTRTVQADTDDGRVEGSSKSFVVVSEKEMNVNCHVGIKPLFETTAHKIKLDAGSVWEEAKKILLFRDVPGVTIDDQKPREVPAFTTCSFSVK